MNNIATLKSAVTGSGSGNSSPPPSPPPLNGCPNGQLDCLELSDPEEDEHRLQYAYVLWFSQRQSGKQNNVQPYDQNLKLIGGFNTVEKFWAVYGHLIRPSEMALHSDFHLFKYGIKPMWEDEANKDGGKWIVRLKKGLASRCWEDLLLAILGEQFMVGEEICGAVVSIRFQEDIISVWNKTANDQHTTIRIRDTLKRVLNLPPNTIMEYKTHNNSLRDKSSFRNTDVFLH
ncbi:eukaryotic translation initiation factor 4E type 2-like [Argiope bruennichi]|uniref:eIF-4F 25 kDa subunit n=1 Tax=Argiope bruennichi TaxID=94029 RepID=A0A8T0FLN6_ARGBR|nr:eukaryotic translation initiation factor 4E type 2-like [Argiope bruennichi]KAF8791138.1 Eukaryotic translation initiation factor 4E like protein [Argiope bruennichi]